MGASPSVTEGVNRRARTSVACARLLFLPAGRRLVVPGMGADPFFALWRVFQLPERRLGLQPIDQELAGLECRFAVRRADGDQHNTVTGLQPAVAMNDQGRLERPAATGLGLDLLQRRLGHAGIVLQGQRIDAVAVIAVAHVQLAHQADEYREAADPAVVPGETVELGADIEVGLLYPHGHAQPPVKGGKNATSVAPASLASNGTVRLSTAAPNAAPSASASAWPPLRSRSQATSSPTVVTFDGGATSSSATPTVRFIQAK